ncbi:MAG: FAD-binding protein, partial [Alphaproteobacteria bacterium]
MTSKVNIVGGGIAGLIAAVELARSSVDVRLFEAAADLGG